MTAGGLAGAPVPTPGMGLGYLCRRSLLSRIEVAVCACSLSSSAVLLVRALMHALLLVRALMHASPRVKIPYVSPLAGNALANWHRSRWLPAQGLANRQRSRCLPAQTSQLWGTEALLDWLLRHRSRQSKRGDNVPIKMTCAVYQQILALFISKSSPLPCSKLSQKVIIDDQWSL